MIILGIETSCDETAVAILIKDKDGVKILSNVVASSANLQAKYGGIIPEQAAREQIKSIIPVIEEALSQIFPDVIPANAGLRLRGRSDSRRIQLTKSRSELDPDIRRDDRIKKIDAIAVTYGPGLIGSLLVGVETAKTLALVWNKPLIPVNHLLGHFYANWIQTEHPGGEVPVFPCLGLLVSGGHTDLVLFTSHGKYDYLGGTRDDAAGECFDKCARLLGLSYPGGPEISKLAQKGNPNRFKLPIPMKGSKDFDFSYSGLKTAVANLVHTSEVGFDSSEVKQDLAAAIENTIVESLVEKVIQALKVHPVKNIMIAGGVAANKKLVDRLQVTVDSLNSNIKLYIPPPDLCTDNGAMIAAAGFFQKPIPNPLKLQADPNLSLA